METATLSLLMSMCLWWIVRGQETCQAQAKGDNSCPHDDDTLEDAEIDRGKYSRASTSGVRLVSSGNIKWHEMDWKSYQNLDIGKDDTKDPFKQFSVNVIKSSELAPNRTIPDNRDLACASVKYDVTSLASSSVIITFRTEPRSTLLRTIVSVLERTPPSLLREIILVDDNNDDESVGVELAKIEKVSLIRNKKREGLIRSRVTASKAAKGEVLVFLDSHCEVGTDWLQPLLQRIKLNRKTVASPVIDNINLATFDLQPVSTFLRGGFDWRLDFFWEWLPASDRARKLRDPTSSVASPAIAGGLFAVARDWFEELGWYDEGMEVWGGENIEISLRVWMCGGSLEIVPCSKVGHVYKKKSPITFPDSDHKATVGCNNWRVAAVWMDQFYGLHKHIAGSGLNETRCGDITDRIKLRKELKCQSFGWFLENIYPELQLPGNGDIAFGTLHINRDNWLSCVDPTRSAGELSVGAGPCLQSHHAQQWRHTAQGRIRQDDFCLTMSAPEAGAPVLQNLCGQGEADLESQGWRRLTPGKSVRQRTGLRGSLLSDKSQTLCLDHRDIMGAGLQVRECDQESRHQRFVFQYISPV